MKKIYILIAGESKKNDDQGLSSQGAYQMELVRRSQVLPVKPSTVFSGLGVHYLESGLKAGVPVDKQNYICGRVSSENKNFSNSKKDLINESETSETSEASEIKKFLFPLKTETVLITDEIFLKNLNLEFFKKIKNYQALNGLVIEIKIKNVKRFFLADFKVLFKPEIYFWPVKKPEVASLPL